MWITDEIVGLTTVDGRRELIGGVFVNQKGQTPYVTTKDKATSFYTFTELPPESNPNLNGISPIYENWFRHHTESSPVYAYDKWIYTDISGNTGENTPIKFYVYTSPRMGTVALYKIEESKYVNESLKRSIIFRPFRESRNVSGLSYSLNICSLNVLNIEIPVIIMARP